MTVIIWLMTVGTAKESTARRTGISQNKSSLLRIMIPFDFRMKSIQKATDRGLIADFNADRVVLEEACLLL